MSPPTRGPSMGPMRDGIATKLMARTSSDLANVRTIVRRPTGTIIAPPPPLEDATKHEEMNAVRHPREHGAGREERDRGREHPPRPVAIGHPAAQGNEDGDAERVATEHRLHAERDDAERARDRGDRGIQDRSVERLHEEGDRDEPRQETPRGASDLRGGFRSGVGRRNVRDGPRALGHAVDDRHRARR